MCIPLINSISTSKFSLGQGEIEYGALTRHALTLNPNPPAMSLHNLFTNRQPYPRAWILLARMQTPKNHKQLLEILPVYANPVVAYPKQPLVVLILRPYPNFWPAPRLVKLEGVANQILKHLGQLHLIGHN